MIDFRPTYPGSPVEQAYLGAVVVGGVHADGKRGAWYCALPSGGMKPLFWNRSDSIEAAREALREQVEGWCRAAEIKPVVAAQDENVGLIEKVGLRGLINAIWPEFYPARMCDHAFGIKREIWLKRAEDADRLLQSDVDVLQRIRAEILKRRKTFCLAMPGSDEEIAAYVSGLDSALELIDQELAILSGREESDV